MASRTVTYSAASTFLAKSGTGTVYGYTVGSPAAGGTVVIADLLNLGAVPNFGIPSTFGPQVISQVIFPASPQPSDFTTYGRKFTDGLTVAISSTQTVSVHFD